MKEIEEFCNKIGTGAVQVVLTRNSKGNWYADLIHWQGGAQVHTIWSGQKSSATLAECLEELVHGLQNNR